jgi:hypothetical protein
MALDFRTRDISRSVLTPSTSTMPQQIVASNPAEFFRKRRKPTLTIDAPIP